MIYKLVLSKGDDIKLDEEDLEKIQNNIAEKLIRIKQGIFNPSFMISIIPTDENEFTKRPNRVVMGDNGAKLEYAEVRTLSDKMNKKLQ